MKKIAFILSITLFLIGCGGGSSTSTSTITGHVSATDGISESIGAGATINLIQIDNQGNKVGNVIATTSTDVDGDYILNISDTYSASTSYAISANDGANTIYAIWTGSITNIDVITDAAKTLLFNTSSPVSGNLASIAASSTGSVNIAEVENCIEVASEMSENGTNKVQNVQDDQEALDQCDSAWGDYSVKGKVTDNNGSPIKGIKVFARDFNNHEKRSSTKTDVDGNYEMDIKLKSGYATEIIIGAMNRTTVSTAASEFYTDASPATGSDIKCYKPHCAKSITITKSTPQTLDFQLAAGSRITGTITGGTSNAKLKRIRVIFREALSRRFRGTVRSNDNGIFNFNIQPGSYIAYFLNATDQQYASTAWTSTGGHVDRNYGEIFTIAAGDSKALDINLAEGGTIKGTVCNTGVTCTKSSDYQHKKIKIRKFSETNRFNNNMEFDTDTVRSNSKSKFKLQVPYGKYRVIGNGKNYNNSDNYYTIDASNKTLNLDINHTTLTAKVKVIDSNGDPLSDIGVQFRNYISGDIIGTSTFSDGSAQVDVGTSDSSKFYIGLTSRGGDPVAACNYDGTTNCSATALNGRKKDHTYSTGEAANTDLVDYTRDISTNTGVLTLTMPTGFVVTGIVTGTDGNASANAYVFYDVLDTLKDSSTGWSNLAGGSTGADGKYSMSLAGSTNYLFKSKLDDDTRIEFRGENESGCAITTDSTKDFDYTNASSKVRYRFYDCTFTTPEMPYTVSGSVTKTDNSKLAKALVRVYINKKTDNTKYRIVEAITDDNGNYSIKLPQDSSATYYYKFIAYYNQAYGSSGFWGSSNENKYIEYGKNKNCAVTENATINFNANTATFNANNGQSSKNIACSNP